MPSSGMWRCVDLVLSDVSEEHIASIFRVEKSASEEAAWTGGSSANVGSHKIYMSPRPRRRHSPHYAVLSRLPLLSLSQPMPKHDLSTLFPDNFNLCSSFDMRDQLSHLHRTTGEFVDIHSLIFTLLDRRHQDERYRLQGSKHFTDLICPQFLPQYNFELLL
jgi:hypothetical protein